jgi:soluble lytic murein transglycosylase-like protein
VSVADTVARVAELQRMLGVGAAPAAPASAPAATDSASFAARLAAVGAPATGDAAGANAATATAGATPGATTPYAAEIDAAATKHNVDPALLRALIRQESNFDAGAVSPAGARGLTQLMPGTAAALGVDPSVPAQAIEGGAKYLRQQLDRFGGDPAKALAAYNAGPGAVQRFGGIPPYAETQNYVRKVMAYAAEYRQAAPAAGAAALATPATASVAAALAAPAAVSAAAPVAVSAAAPVAAAPAAGSSAPLPYSTT